MVELGKVTLEEVDKPTVSGHRKFQSIFRIVKKPVRFNDDFYVGFPMKTFRDIGDFTCFDVFKIKDLLDEDKYIDMSSRNDFCFDADLPIDRKELTEVKRGDIINIRTMIDLELPDDSNFYDGGIATLYKHMFDTWEENIEHIVTNTGKTFLVTFLIELDPL